MSSRTILERFDRCWSAACIWIVRRSPLPADQAVQLLERLARLIGRPRPCPARAR